MLKLLRILNIILIESAEISFKKGLNVLSGETGSGKSAIIDALKLIAGERAEISLIRKGAEKGTVEAAFEIENLPHLQTLLDASGIEHENKEELIIRREITLSGKSRAFINNQLVQQGLLRKVGENLLNFVGQHANQRLFSLEYHRYIVDLFGELEDPVKAFSLSWEKENRLRRQLEELQRSEAQRLRDIEVCRMELEELDQANLQEGEDEELFTEYSRLSHSKELAQKAYEITHTLSGDKNPILAIMGRQKSHFDHLQRLDPSLSETAKSFEAALIELEEVAYSLRNYQSRIEHSPEKIEMLNERLTLINRLKRKYGQSLSDIHTYQKQSQAKLDSLLNADNQIEGIKTELACLEAQNNLLASNLTEKRKAASKLLEIAMVNRLKALNMPKVDFQIGITPQKRNASGQDTIEFFLIPNIGEHRIPIRDGASGGELSRLLLALHAILAGKEQTPCLIFDEIDGNIGGKTALIIGEKLKEISELHQVLCITHFPQVASQALHHIQISKQECNGRTLTHIKTLDKELRQQELKRMIGGLEFVT